MGTFDLELQMFAEGGGGEGGGGLGGGNAEAAGAAAENAGAGGQSLGNVQYGIVEDAPATQTQVESNTQVDRSRDFENLIKGEYKDEFAKRTQQIINQRFKETKAMQESMGQMQTVIDALQSRYGESDFGKLVEAINNDDSYYQNEADERGLTVEQLKEMKAIQRENEQLRQQMEQRRTAEATDRIYQGWMDQSEQLKQVYPGFDLNAEVNDPNTGKSFSGLLRNGVDVKTAYEVVHKDELLSGAIGYAVQQTQQRTVEQIRQRGMRPAENGVGGSAATSIVKRDPSKWTREDRKEVERRVLRGEKIKL